MLDYSALSALAAVIREGSFERAALALHVTPSAVSQRIKLLEERVGCALVVRDQPCRATETGRRLCQHVDRVRLLEQELQGTLPSLAPKGIARVALPIAVNADSLATWFAPAMAAFAADAPVLMEVAVDDQDHTTEWLRSGAVLAAVTGTSRPAAGCNSRPLGAMRYLRRRQSGLRGAPFRRRRGRRQPGQGAQPGVQHQGRVAGALGAAPVPPACGAAPPHPALASGFRRRRRGRHGLGPAAPGTDRRRI